MPKSPAALSIRLGILGPATLGVDDGPAHLFKGRRPLRVLAYLLLHRRNPVLREPAAAALWPDDDKEAAHANLRRHLYLLAQALPPSRPGVPWIIGESDRVQINAEARIFVDADEFEILATRGAHELAAERYGGDLFVTLDDTWVASERERLRSLYLTALSELVPQYRRRRDFTRAMHYAQQLLGADPWREDVLRQLMSVRYEAGDSAGALSEYDAFARRLRCELNVDPMHETSTLREAIVSGHAIDRDATPVEAEASTLPRRIAHELPFAGREADLGAFTARWNDAAHGRGGVVAVSGEAGIGKTRLVREMAAYASAHGGRALFGTTAYPELQPYESLAEALRSALPLVALVDAPHAIATLAQIVPELSEKQFDLQAFASGAPDDRQRRLFDAIVTILRGLAKPRPVLVILEDLHWAGSGTLAALQYVAARIARAPVLIVATYREEEVGRLHGLRAVLRTLRAQNLLTEFSPGLLTEADVFEIVTHVASVEGDKVSIARRLFERSEGNPLFLNEIVDAMADSPAEPAATLQKTVEARVARLSPAAKSFVEIASAAGSGFDVEVIREVTGWTGSQATDALDELLSRRLVRELPGRHGLAFSFSHQLVQEAIYGGIAASDRIARHRRIATVVEELYADRLEDFSRDLARHYDLAGEPSAAGRYYLLAAHRAAELYADDEAIDAADRALERTPHGEPRRDILLLREGAFGRRGRRAEQHADLDELDAIAADHADRDLAWQVQRRRCLLARAEGDVDVERSSIALLTAQARDTGNIGWQAEAMKLAATFSLVTDYDYERCNAAAATALELRDRLGDTSGAIEALCILAQNEMHGGSWERARQFAQDAHARATTEQNTAVVARATIALAQAALPRQEFAVYREMAGKALTMFRAIGDVENEAAALNGIGNACTHLGELAAAREHLTRAADLFQSIGVRRGVTVALINVGVIDWALGRLDAAYAAISQARQEAMELDYAIGLMIATTDLSGIARMLHRLDEALELANEVVALARRSKLPLYEAAGLAQAAAAKRARGELAAAIDDLEAAVALFDGLQHPADEAEARAELAASYLDAGEIDKAVVMTRTFLALPQDALIAGMFPQALHLIAARVYHAAGQPDLSRAHVDAASRLVEKRLEQCTDDASGATFSQLPVNIAIAEAARNLSP
jgi:DNA-binding SARP family transcriptional activator/tetratricopeptide (TPR) repeat protein